MHDRLDGLFPAPENSKAEFRRLNIARHDQSRSRHKVVAKEGLPADHRIGSDPRDARDALCESVTCDGIQNLAAIHSVVLTTKRRGRYECLFAPWRNVRIARGE